MKTENVSIIIPAYNEEMRIEKCLDALLPQLLSGDEILLVDNNSNDATVRLARKYPGVRVLHEPKQGQVFAQARGFNSAKNEVLARIDADSIVTDRWLPTIRQYFSNKEIQALTGPGLSYDLIFQTIPTMIMGFWTFQTNRLISGHYPLWGSNFVIRKSVWKQVAPFMRMRQDIWEDFEMGIELYRQHIPVMYDSKFAVGYSNRSIFDTTVWQAFCYQMRAPKTYYVTGYPLKAALSLLERAIMIALVAPLVLVEWTIQVVIGDRRPNLRKLTKVLGFDSGQH